MSHTPRFLTAEWRNLAMLNYAIAPAALAGRVPAGCELDFWNGRTFVSVVGFQFLHTRVLGLPIPFHQHFEEVNLRFYVRRKVEGTWRRGVVFIRELVPRRAIAWVARCVYGENYSALPMRHLIERSSHDGTLGVSYEWRRGGTWEGLTVHAQGAAVLPPEDSEAAFITEHYWGYVRRSPTHTVEYQVTHPRWRVWHAVSTNFICDVASLYGPAFVEPLAGAPSSALIADGSAVVVCKGCRVR